MSLLGRHSTIDTALEDIRRGLVDAEAFMEICRFDYKRLRRPKAGARRADCREEGAAIFGRTAARRKSAAAASLRRPRATKDGKDRDIVSDKEPRETPTHHDLPVSDAMVAATEDSPEPLVEEAPATDSPPATDQTEWPEMPDFLVRKG